MQYQEHKYPLSFCIGQRIKALRKQYRMPASALAEKLKMSQQQISRYERGCNKMDINSLVNIAKILNVNIHYFFECVPCKNTNNND